MHDNARHRLTWMFTLIGLISLEKSLETINSTYLSWHITCINHRIITYRMSAPILVSKKSVSTKWPTYKGKINSPQDFLL